MRSSDPQPMPSLPGELRLRSQTFPPVSELTRVSSLPHGLPGGRSQFHVFIDYLFDWPSSHVVGIVFGPAGGCAVSPWISWSGLGLLLRAQAGPPLDIRQAPFKLPSCPDPCGSPGVGGLCVGCTENLICV